MPTIIEQQMEEFEKLDIEVSPPMSLEDKEIAEKLKYFCPIVWKLFKPDIKSFLKSSMEKAYQAGLHEHFFVADKRTMEWMKNNTEGMKMVDEIKRKVRVETLEEVEKKIILVKYGYKCGKCYGAKVEHTHLCKGLFFLSEMIKRLKL